MGWAHAPRSPAQSLSRCAHLLSYSPALLLAVAVFLRRSDVPPPSASPDTSRERTLSSFSSSSSSRTLPLLLPPPPHPLPSLQLKLRGPDAVEPRAPKRRPVEPTTSRSQRRYASVSSSIRRRAGKPPPSSRNRSDPPPPPSSKVRLRPKSHVSITQRLVELQRAKRPRRGEVDAAEAAVDGRKEGQTAGSSPRDESLVARRPSHCHCNCSCKNPETSSAAVEERLDPAIRGGGQKLDNEKMDGKDQNDHKTPSRSARRKKIKRQIWQQAKKQAMEMKKDKLLENIKKLQACVWLLEKEGADMAEIMEFRSLLESAKKQYVENEAQSAKEGSSASHQGLNEDKREKMHVETMAAPIEKVDPMISKDWQNMDALKIQKYHKVENSSAEKVDHMIERDEQNILNGKAECRSLKGCKAISKRSELAEEVDYLKSELELVRQDRDDQLAQVQSLMADIGKQKEIARRCGVELENAMRRVSALEEGCLLQRETIKTLEIQLASANEKLTVSSSTKECC